MTRRGWRGLLSLVLGIAVLAPGAAWAAQPASSAAGPLTIVNGNSAGPILALDALGNSVDAHDGSLLYAEGAYHLYGTSYGCGYVRLLPRSPFCGFVSYHSRDLQHWHADGALFDARNPRWQQACNGSTLSCYRPHVVYNSRTHRYVLWINSYDGGPGHRQGTFHVMTSVHPAGPFSEIARPHVVDAFAGDLDVFVDSTGRAYLAYTGWQQGADIIIEELNTSFTDTIGRWSRVGASRVESPALFRRGNTYYLTVSQPACAYCAGTGTGYFTATSPLGPWNGASNATVQVVNGSLWLRGNAGFGPTVADGTVRATFTPLASARTAYGSYAAASIYFRARDVGNGYRWILGTRPVAGAPHGGLTTEVRVGGRVVSSHTVPLALPAGSSHTVEITGLGARLTTRVDGLVVDARTDTRFASGRVGLMVSGTESVRVSDVVVMSGEKRTQFFRHSLISDLAAWSFTVAHQHGILLSAKSCGGQPADVLMLPSVGKAASTPLLMIDRWNGAAPNEALAGQFWEPLRFRGVAILPLQCRSSYRVASQAGVDTNVVDRLLDVSTGWRGFRVIDGVRGGQQLGQTFRVGRTGVLYRLGMNVLRNWRTAPIYLQIREVLPGARLGRILFQTAIHPHWSPDLMVVAPGIRVSAGQGLAVILRSPGGGVGTVGALYHDLNPYTRGSAIRSDNNGETFTRLPGDLRVVTDVVAH